MPDNGTYWGTVTGGECSESKNGKPQITVNIALTHKSNGIEWEPITPIESRMIWYLSEKAMKFHADDLRSIGFNGDFNSPSFSSEPRQFECYSEIYEGKTIHRWRLGYQQPEQKKLDNDTIRKLTAFWKNSSGSYAPSGKPSIPAQKQEVRPDHEVPQSTIQPSFPERPQSQ
jgi:hypothetical protein